MDERDPQLDGAPGALYRTLPSEEPPARLDAAVLAAARASVAPKRDRRWAAPVALAAMLVLSVGVSLRVADERPDAQFKAESPAVTPPAAVPASPPVDRSVTPSPEKIEAPASAKAEPLSRPRSTTPQARSVTQPAPEAAPAAKPEPQAGASVRQELAKSVAPAEERAAAPAAAAPVSPPPPVAFVPSPRADSAPPRAQESAPSAAAGAAVAERPAARELRMGKNAAADSSLASAAAQSPEAWLERIAQLRAQGRHREADESYVEFRRRYPAFVIAPELLPKVAPGEMRSR